MELEMINYCRLIYDKIFASEGHSELEISQYLVDIEKQLRIINRSKEDEDVKENFEKASK